MSVQKGFDKAHGDAEANYDCLEQTGREEGLGVVEVVEVSGDVGEGSSELMDERLQSSH